jgi:transposase
MRTRRYYANDFKLETVKLIESGKASQAQVARDLGVPESVLSRWCKEFGQRPDGSRVTPSEHAELVQLRRENAQLKLEREILKKAMGICARELP